MMLYRISYAIVILIYIPDTLFNSYYAVYSRIHYAKVAVLYITDTLSKKYNVV